LNCIAIDSEDSNLRMIAAFSEIVPAIEITLNQKNE